MGTKDQGEYRSPEEAAAAAKFNKDQMLSRGEAADQLVVTREMYDEAHDILEAKSEVADIDFEWAEAVSDVFNARGALERFARNEEREEANSLARMVENKKRELADAERRLEAVNKSRSK